MAAKSISPGGWRGEDTSDGDTVEMPRPSGSERRRETRLPQEVRVMGRFAGRLVSCRTGDISEGGLFLRTRYAPPVGTFVQLGFSADREQTLFAEGHVRWVRVESDGRTTGCGIALSGGVRPTDLVATL
jgi:hypothetical protein